MSVHPLDRSNLRARYRFKGKLILETALHIGGGREYSNVTDSPILRDSVGRPIIPGSSFKGAFRAGVERLIHALSGFRSCQLVPEHKDCLSANSKQAKDYRVVSEAAIRGLSLGCGTNERALMEQAALERLQRKEWIGQQMNEGHLLDLLKEYLCDTCKTFGSPHLASVVHFHDLPVKEPWGETIQIRDGVGIDRDSERAKDQVKFDYEVVPAQTEFEFVLSLENPTERDLGLVAVGLQEFINGMIPLGGIRSRGLGRCHLHDLNVVTVDFTDPNSLRDYLVHGWPTAAPLGDFVERHAAKLLGS